MNKSCMILLAHGSKKESWRKPFKQLLRHLRRGIGDDKIYLAFMESANPTLKNLACALAGRGVGKIQILPLFMASGNHMRRDIPEQVRIIKKECPALRIKVMPPIGLHPRFRYMMRELIMECMV